MIITYLLLLIKRQSDKERMTNRTPSQWFTPQMPTVAWTGPGEGQELETQLRSPMWMAKTQLLHPPPADSQGLH